MKIVFLVKYFDGFILEIENKIKKLGLSGYDQMMQVVLADTPTLVNYFQELSGNAHMIVPNSELLQKTWCLENNVEYDSDYLFSVPLAQIKFINPDVLFLNSNFEYYDHFLDPIRPDVKVICSWISCPFDKAMDLSKVDHVFTSFKPHFEFFNSSNVSSSLVHAGFDKRVLDALPKEKIYDLSFVGGIGKFHKRRKKLLSFLVKRTPIKIWGYGFKSKNRIKNIAKQILGNRIFNKAFQGEIWGSEMLCILSQSKITLNVHGDIAEGHAVNSRMFEATGAGTLLITEWTDSIQEFFVPDEEIVCYKSFDEALDKINYYLRNDDERIRISANGQRKTLENYTYEHMAKKIFLKFNDLIAKKSEGEKGDE